jgi:hypothetical protein
VGSGREEFRRFSLECMKRRLERYPERKKARMEGYQGESVGNFNLVRREYDGHQMMWATGSDAETLAEEFIGHGIRAQCNRIDIAVTARCAKPYPAYPERIRKHITKQREQEGKKQRTPMGLFNDKTADTGTTLGVRGTAKYARIYDFEAKHYKTTTSLIYRHEVELRKLAAKRLWEQYFQEPQKKALALSTAHYELENWGLPCAWMSDAGKHKVSATAAPTTDEKRLEHLDKSVCRFISGLVERGHEEEVRRIIARNGLDHLFNWCQSEAPERGDY